VKTATLAHRIGRRAGTLDSVAEIAPLAVSTPSAAVAGPRGAGTAGYQLSQPGSTVAFV
jgi:hypothetical protein